MTTETTLPPFPGTAPTDPRAAAQHALDAAVAALDAARKSIETAKTDKAKAQAIIDAAKPTIMLAEAQVTIAKANLLKFGAAPKSEGGDKVSADQVIAILRAAPSQMTAADILARLAEQGINASADNLKTYLSRWAAAGAIIKGEKNNRLEPARYYAPPVANGTVPPMPGLVASGLPEDFPGKEHLEKAGYTKVEDVPSDFDTLFAIDGIGKATANAIVKALG